ncbi:hypothetical protein [Frigoribacterium sp. UYMn621]|uniref:cytochrome b/b6 domain-containing protein n=1 Tax=Frigoribacterium sp. UYMn621 TaxID=3156343 RepID=UPI003398CDEA
MTTVAALRNRHTLLWCVAALIAMVVVVLIARWLREMSAVQSFVFAYPGATPLPTSAPIGLPAWVGWQHFLNVFFMVLIVKTGWSVRTKARPAAYWTRMVGPTNSARPPKRISLDLWFHLSLDVLWMVNGILFIVLLFATAQWVRLVPTSWEVVPNALSTALQYASLNWPTENGWVNYNSLQLLAYFSIVFVAAPLAIITGVRMSPLWPDTAERAGRVFPIELARAVHYPVMLYFVLFAIAHVTLVLATGALRNLNHMYAARDETSWVGFALFAASAVAMVAAWIFARPVILRPIAALTGKLNR